MRIHELNEAPVGFLNRMKQKVVSKVPGDIGAKAQGSLDTAKVANKWKTDYMRYLGRIGQKADTENLKAFLKSLGMKDADANAMVGESALIERALTGRDIDKIMLKAARQGGGEAMGVGGKSAGGAEPSDTSATASPGGTAPAAGAPAAPKQSLAFKAGKAVGGLASKAASAFKKATAPGGAPAGGKVEPTISAPPAAKPAAASPAAAKPAGSDIDTYINNWAKTINAAATPQQKINLAKEVIGFLKDRKDSPEGKRGSAMARSVLKRSGDPQLQQMAKSSAFALERRLYQIVNKLFEAVGVTWKDLGYRISITESTMDYVIILKR